MMCQSKLRLWALVAVILVIGLSGASSQSFDFLATEEPTGSGSAGSEASSGAGEPTEEPSESGGGGDSDGDSSAPNATAIIPIARNKYFFFAGEDRFQVTGMAYYPRPNTGELDENNIDFYSDDYAHMWKRDLPVMKELGINTIRLYAIDPGLNHDNFFCELGANGMYAIVGVGAECENCAIGKEDAPECYSQELLERAKFIISEFSKYPNVLGFSAGNEVNYAAPPPHTGNAPCQKALIRDMRAFIKGCESEGMRQIPVGLAQADYDRELMAAYYGCRDDDDDNSVTEWYGINSYLYCDDSVKSYGEEFALKELAAVFTDISFPAPVLLTEYGCINPSFPDGQRSWIQTKWILEEDINQVFSGAVAFEYSTELSRLETPVYPPFGYDPANYGVVYFSPEDCDEQGTQCAAEKLGNYENLRNMIATAQRPTITLSEYSDMDTGREEPTSCPAEIASISEFDWPKDDSVECNVVQPPMCFRMWGAGGGSDEGGADGDEDGSDNDESGSGGDASGDGSEAASAAGSGSE